MKEKEIHITLEDIMDGIRTIMNIDTNIIPALIGPDGKKAGIGDMERLVIIATGLLALAPDSKEHDNGYIDVKVNYKELATIVDALKKVNAHWDAVTILGGIVSIIKAGELSDYQDYLDNEFEHPY